MRTTADSERRVTQHCDTRSDPTWSERRADSGAQRTVRHLSRQSAH
jgi:hypothetical protein